MKHITKGIIYDLLHVWLGTGLLTSTSKQIDNDIAKLKFIIIFLILDSKWQNRRKILTPAFHFNILQKFIDIFNKETDNLVNILKAQSNESYIDVIKPITEFTLNSIGGKFWNNKSTKSSLHRQTVVITLVKIVEKILKYIYRGILSIRNIVAN